VPSKNSPRAELDDLHADLPRSASDRQDPPADGNPDWVSDIEKLGLELHAKFCEATEDAKDVLSAHPLASVTAALLLGIVIGCMMGRGR
jgi:hypothetical protein